MSESRLLMLSHFDSFLNIIIEDIRNNPKTTTTVGFGSEVRNPSVNCIISSHQGVHMLTNTISSFSYHIILKIGGLTRRIIDKIVRMLYMPILP